MQYKKGFTLLEMLLVVIISGSLLTTIYSVMITLPRVKHFNDARQALIEETNSVISRFAELFQDYTIDYEEYFNRSKVGLGETNGHYSAFSAFGNQNKIIVGGVNEQAKHRIKYCSSNNDIIQGKYYDLAKCKAGGTVTGVQSFGQYKMLFRDVGTDTDGKDRINPIINNTGIPDPNNNFQEVGDSDDRDLGEGPSAIPVDPKEIYLISHDGQRRIFLRLNTRPDSSTSIQILRLRGFDAGSEHKFDPNDPKTYDGEIDTWACDYGQGFQCNGTVVGDGDTYKRYKLANGIDDGRVNLFDSNISVKSWKIHIAPNTNPDYAWKTKDIQINPYLSISLTTELNYNKWKQKLGNMLSGYTYSLKGVYDTKGFYLK